MKIGSEDKKKVAVLGALLVVIVPVAIWELSGYFGGGTPTPRPVPAVTTPAQRNASSRTTATATTGSTSGPEAQRISGVDIDPNLHLDRLALSEDVEYAGTGRNIFSAESAPAPNIPPPAAPPRGDTDVAVNQAPPAPTAPQIDIKYFGYEQSKDKSTTHAFLIHGEDIFMAKTGEIVEHRYKVGNISPGSIQVTDMAYNNTQTLALMQQ
jgi:hypothetical protein